MEAPVQRFARHVVRDYALHDQVMRRGDTVIIHLASANRDAEEFPEPDRFDPLREHLNRHLSFGWGTHYCLGAPLARLEGCLALQALWEKCFPDWQVSPDWVPEWNENLGFRGLKRLPLVKKC